MNTSTNFESINFESLDAWLESDLLQSGIILADEKQPKNDAPVSMMTPAQVLMASPPISECTPNMAPSIEPATPMITYEPLSPIETPKIEPQDTTTNNVDLQPFIKALALLSSIQTQKDNTTNEISNKRERTEEENSTEDVIALKRQRNTDAARRSRLRKALKMESLEKRVSELETENEQLKLQTAVAESERANIEAKEKRSRVRILELERQIVDTQKILTMYIQKETTAAKALKV